MIQPGINDDAPLDASRDEMMSALFAHMVIQNSNMALMFLGKVPHPQSGGRLQDLEAAKMFIDQLEMLEAKTKGNLAPEEQKLLQQSLMHLRMTFVETVGQPPKKEEAKPAEAAATTPPPAAETAPSASAPTASAPHPSEPAEEEPRKRFSKKF
jgi:hypothetical protein